MDKGRREEAGVHEAGHEVIHKGSMWCSGTISMIRTGAGGESGRVM